MAKFLDDNLTTDKLNGILEDGFPELWLRNRLAMVRRLKTYDTQHCIEVALRAQNRLDTSAIEILRNEIRWIYEHYHQYSNAHAATHLLSQEIERLKNLHGVSDET